MRRMFGLSPGPVSEDLPELHPDMDRTITIMKINPFLIPKVLS
jgi:hypothetical protein